jgi:surface polysaccharide O-acyltransferase-like enzyme
MPRKLLSKALEAARQTPASRNRAADLYRSLAICFVVLGHWMLVAPYVPDNELELRNILALQPWVQYLTWLFQVMPVFFFVGGYSNAASWSSARASEEKRRNWATGRLRRLLLPVVPLVLLWAVAAAVAFQLGVEPELATAASRAALIPVWFLAVYILVTLVVPVTFAIWEKLGLWSVTLLAVLAIVIDLVGVGMGQGWLRWGNYAAVWLAVHQLGYWWRRGDQGAGGIGLLLLIGVVWMSVLVSYAGYPISMVSVPGEVFSNTRPPTTAMLALGAVQVSLLLLLARPVNAWLQKETPWATVILISQNIMTIYLWHLTVVIVVAGLSLAFGGFGLKVEPGTAAWWVYRPLWIAVLAVLLLPFLAIFGQFESGSRARRGSGAGLVQASFGAVLTCAGLTILALNGVSLDRFPGFNWIACVLTVVGVVIATRRISPDGSGHRGDKV